MVFVSRRQTRPSAHVEVVQLASLDCVFHTGAQLWRYERRRLVEIRRLKEDQTRESYSLRLL